MDGQNSSVKTRIGFIAYTCGGSEEEEEEEEEEVMLLFSHILCSNI